MTAAHACAALAEVSIARLAVRRFASMSDRVQVGVLEGCRGSEQGMVCDQPTLAGATPLTYTGSGLAYQSVPLVSTGPGAPLVLANSVRLSAAQRQQRLPGLCAHRCVCSCRDEH